jgi:hypothetical protein
MPRPFQGVALLTTEGIRAINASMKIIDDLGRMLKRWVR